MIRVSFFDALFFSMQRVWEIHVIILDYPFVNAFLIENASKVEIQGLYKGIFSACAFCSKK